MNDATSQLLYFSNRHPISRDIILAKLQASAVISTIYVRRNCLRTTRITMVASRPRTNWRCKLRSAQERSSPTFAQTGGTVRYLAYKYGAKVGDERS